MKKIIFLLAMFLATNILSLSASADMGRVSNVIEQQILKGKNYASLD